MLCEHEISNSIYVSNTAGDSYIPENKLVQNFSHMKQKYWFMFTSELLSFEVFYRNLDYKINFNLILTEMLASCFQSYAYTSMINLSQTNGNISDVYENIS